MDTYMYAILPIIGIVLGATLQYIFSSVSEKWKWQQKLRTQAYADFIKSAAEISISYQKKDYDESLDTLLLDARARIAIYGSKEVVENIAELYRSGPKTNTINKEKLLINIIHAMRKDSLPKEQRIIDKEISQLLFSKDMK